MAKKGEKMNILQQMLNFVGEFLVSIWGLIVLCSVFALNMLETLHTTMPFLEGLLVGLGSAYAFHYKDNNIFAKIISMPLKLTLDALNYTGRQLKKLAQSGLSVAKKPFVWFSGGGKWLYEALKKAFKSLKAKFSRTKD